jgi:hypothetical protein
MKNKTSDTSLSVNVPPGSSLRVVIRAKAAATVIRDLAAPASVTANPSSVFTCAQTSVNLTGNSTTGGVSYAWAGPNGFSSNLRVVPTPAPGAYTLTVTNPLNGCTAVKALTVRQNIDPPANVTIAAPDTLTADVSSVTLTVIQL